MSDLNTFRPSMFRSRGILFMALLVPAGLQIADAGASVAALPPDRIALGVFLGQVYPSGNIYLKGFNDELGDLPSAVWPTKVIFRGLAKEEGAARFQFGSFRKVFGSADYLPGLEHMDNGHAPCGKDLAYMKNPKFNYLEPDFFNATSNYCDPNDGVALYAGGAKNNQSFQIVAFAPALAIQNIKVSDGSEGRPLAPGEADEITRKKKAGASALNDCTTVPAYLSDAVLLATLSIADTPNTLRLSSYDDPGCMGHLETIYVLDVLEDDHFQKRYELHQFRGGA